MILKFANSQVLTPLTPNKLHRHQSNRWWTKPLLLPWKLLRNLTKMVAKVRKLRISKALVRIKAKRKLFLILRRKPQMLLSPSPTRLLTHWPPKWKLRILGHFYYFYLFAFTVVVIVVGFFFFFFFFVVGECTILSLWSMKAFFFYFLYLHCIQYEIYCYSRWC